MTEYESYHLLDSVSLEHGMLENERHKVLLEYMKAKFEVNMTNDIFWLTILNVILYFHLKLFPDLTLTATLAQYTDRDRTWLSSSGALENRDILLEILSDAMVLAPLIQLVDIQSEVNDNTYFYVFSHRNALSKYDKVDHCYKFIEHILVETNIAYCIIRVYINTYCPLITAWGKWRTHRSVYPNKYTAIAVSRP